MLSSCQIVSTTTVVFSKKTELMDPPNAGNQKTWDGLIPIGRGFVNISNAEAYGLMPGIPTPSGTDRYAVAMFHQLHCLVSYSTSLAQARTEVIGRLPFVIVTGGLWTPCLKIGPTPLGRRSARASFVASTLSIALRILRRASGAQVI